MKESQVRQIGKRLAKSKKRGRGRRPGEVESYKAHVGKTRAHRPVFLRTRPRAETGWGWSTLTDLQGQTHTEKHLVSSLLGEWHQVYMQKGSNKQILPS